VPTTVASGGILEQGTATVRILSTDGSSEFLRLDHGVWFGSQILFRYVTNHPYYPTVTSPAVVDYQVTFSANAISLGGSITSEVPCCDIPHTFAHSDVNGSRIDPLPDLYTFILPGFSFWLSTNQVFPGDMLLVQPHRKFSPQSKFAPIQSTSQRASSH
jgi:hypothetical protein